jgi:hypothetical protein
MQIRIRTLTQAILGNLNFFIFHFILVYAVFVWTVYGNFLEKSFHLHLFEMDAFPNLDWQALDVNPNLDPAK